jgi:hypothetical protein
LRLDLSHLGDVESGDLGYGLEWVVRVQEAGRLEAEERPIGAECAREAQVAERTASGRSDAEERLAAALGLHGDQAVRQARRQHVIPRSLGDPMGQAGHGRRVEDLADRYIHRTCLAQSSRQSSGQQAVASPLEEVIVDAGLLDLQEFGDEGQDLGFQGRTGRRGMPPLRLGLRQVLESNLPIGRERHASHPNEGAGDHVGRQAVDDPSAEFVGKTRTGFGFVGVDGLDPGD